MKTRQNKKGCVILAVILIMAAAVVLYGCFGEKMENDEKKIEIGANQTSDDIMNQIKHDYFNQLIRPIDASVLFKDLEIQKKYGEFEGYIVVRFNPFFSFPDGEGMPIDIGGVTIPYGRALVTIIWKDRQAFTLISAQENSLLSQESLREIALITLADPLFK